MSLLDYEWSPFFLRDSRAKRNASARENQTGSRFARFTIPEGKGGILVVYIALSKLNVTILADRLSILSSKRID